MRGSFFLCGVVVCVWVWGGLVSQNRKNYMIYDIFKAFLYHKMREIEAFMIFFPAFVS